MIIGASDGWLCSLPADSHSGSHRLSMMSSSHGRQRSVSARYDTASSPYSNSTQMATVERSRKKTRRTDRDGSVPHRRRKEGMQSTTLQLGPKKDAKEVAAGGPAAGAAAPSAGRRLVASVARALGCADGDDDTQ